MSLLHVSTGAHLSSRPTVVILTALEDEFTAVCSHLVNRRSQEHRDVVYEVGEFVAPETTWTVFVAEIGPGNEGAAAEAQRAVDFARPAIAFFVGVAGGVKDVTVGDVVAATIVRGYEMGADAEEFKPRHQIGQSTELLVQWARNVRRDRNWLMRLAPATPAQTPRVFVAPIAAGNKVLKSRVSELFLQLQTHCSDCLAVEMEGIGFLTALNRNRDVMAIVIRGISDLLANKKESDRAGLQAVAAQAAAAFAFELLARVTPPKNQALLDAPQAPSDVPAEAWHPPPEMVPATLIEAFEASSRDTIRAALQDDQVCICAFPGVSPVDSTGIRDPYRCHHLGHLFFSYLFEQIIAFHANTALLVCPSRTYYLRYSEDFTRMMTLVGANWLHCFAYRTRLFNVTEFIYSQTITRKYFQLFSWLQEKERSLRSFGSTYLEQIDAWRSGTPLPLPLVQKLTAVFAFPEGRFSVDQIASLAYVLVARPGWYAPDWFTKALKSFLLHRNSVQMRLLGTNDIVIIEAQKNMTTWEPMAVCSSFFELGTFPRRAYFRNLPAADGRGAMRTSERSGTIFLFEDSAEVLRRFDHQSLVQVVRMFDSTVSLDSVASRLTALLHDGATRLQQRGDL